LDLPPDFEKELTKNKEASRYFAKIAPSHKKAFITYISEAKKPETRQRRILDTIKKMNRHEKQNNRV
jgi:uncharacterized protein YdeI (YjbR/CyaY-like superfamily)